MTVIGVDCTNIGYGGGGILVSNYLNAFHPKLLGIDKLIIWSNPGIAERLKDKQHFEIIIKQKQTRLLARLFWQTFKLQKEAESHNCAALVFPGGLYLGRFRPYFAAAQNLLPFHKKALKLYRWKKKYLRYLLLRSLHIYTFNRARQVFYLSEESKEIIERYLTRDQSSVGSRQSSVRSSQLAVGKVQKTVSNRQKSVGSRENSVGSKKYLVDSKRESVNSRQSSVRSEQKSVDSREYGVDRKKNRENHLRTESHEIRQSNSMHPYSHANKSNVIESFTESENSSQSFNHSIMHAAAKNRQSKTFDKSHDRLLHPVLSEQFYKHKWTPPNNEIKRILYVSSFKLYKNHIWLCREVKKRVDAGEKLELVLVGDTDDSDAKIILKEIKKLNQHKKFINVVGFVEHENIIGYYLNADFFVYPSLCESFGMGESEANKLRIKK